MAGDDFEIASGDVRIRVEGLGKTLRAMSAAGADAQNMRDLMHSLGTVVVNAAHPPIGETGRLATTVRAGRGKTKAVVRAGGARAPYAGVTHYGWPAHNIEAQPFLSNALNEQRGTVLKDLDDGIARILQDNKLT